MMPALPRRLMAEALGTAILVLFGAGSVVAAVAFNEGGALDYPSLGIIAFAFGLAIATAIHAYGNTSGAHINPSVTIALAASRRFPWSEVPSYIAAQLVGAVTAGFLLWAFLGEIAPDSGMGQTSIAPGTNYLQAIICEALGTFLLMTSVMALAVDRRAPGGWAPLGIGLAIAAAIMVTGPFTGGSLNPARTFGPLFTGEIAGSETFWGDLGAYIIGPIVGALAAALSYDAVVQPRQYEAAVAQGTAGVIEGDDRPRERAEEVVGERRTTPRSP